MTVKQALEQHAVTRELSPRERQELAAVAQLRTFPAGSHLIREGQVCPGLFLILSGEAEVELHGGGSGGLRRIQTLLPGEAAGWSWALAPYRSAFDVRAGQELLALELAGPGLRALGETDPALGYRLMTVMLGVLAERLRNTRYQVMDLY